MAISTVIRQGLRLAGKIDRKYNINKIFIEKYFPPNLRQPARRIVDIAGALGGGYSVYGVISNFIDDDGLEQDNGFSQTFQPRSKTRPQYKAYSGQSRDYSYRNKNKCPPYNRRRRSSYRKY